MKIDSPAKVNLFLRITGKRPDGYHNLFSLMSCIGLKDTVSLSFAGSGIRVSCTSPSVPADESNLAHRAAVAYSQAMEQKTGSQIPGLHIHINKQIPIAAGLGGGSSNAAAVLQGLNAHFNRLFSHADLRAMGVALGADVPFFISGQPAIATGVGDRLETFKNIEPFKVVLIYPGFCVSTAAVYKNLNLRLTNCKKKLRYTLLKQKGFQARHHLCNDLETVTAREYPEVKSAKNQLVRHGAVGALMSGSGPSVFGLFRDGGVAQTAALRLKTMESWQVFLTELVFEGGGRLKT